jgi:acetyl-CoA carboxylase carboxyl transferase subunit alpha
LDEDNFEEPILALERRIDALSGMGDDVGIRRQREGLQQELEVVRARVYSGLTPWQKTLVARHARRPYTLDYLRFLLSGFVEIHGDRKYADDPAIVAGFGSSGDGRWW